MNHSSLHRDTPIAPRNNKRAREHERRNFGPRAVLVRAMPCSVAAKHDKDQAGPSWEIRGLLERGHKPEDLACSGTVEAAHAGKARGMGGCNSNDRKIAPLCHKHAVEADEPGTSERAAFEALYGLDLIAICDELAVTFDAIEGIE